MITVKDFHVRQGDNGKEYLSLELEGEVAFIQSQNTGRFYAAAKRCFMFGAMTEDSAKALIGTKMPGSIDRVPCDPYDYTVPETGEVISLAYTYQYVPEGADKAELALSSKTFP